MRLRELFENQTVPERHSANVEFELDGGILVVWPNAPHAPRSASVIEFIIPEASRNQGIGTKLVAMANKQFPDLGAQVSSLASLKAFYNNGFHNPKLGDSSFEELAKAWQANGGSLFVANSDRDGNSFISEQLHKGGVKISELFDQPVSYSWEEFTRRAGQASFKIGDMEYDVLITCQVSDEREPDEDDDLPDADVEFAYMRSGERVYDITSGGNSNKVFTTVVAIMRDYLTRYPVASLIFSANEPSRQRLYTSMVRRLLPKWVISRRDDEFYAAPPDALQEGFVIDPSFVNFYNDDDELEHRRLVNVKVGAFDNAWKTGRHANQYISVNGQGSIKTRYQDFGKWLSTAKEPIQASTVDVDRDGSVSFYNGRHRYSWLRDQGVKTIPMAMDRESIKNAKRVGLI